MLRGKYKNRNKLRITPHTGPVQILQKYELRKIHEKQCLLLKLLFTIFNSSYNLLCLNVHKQ